MIPSFSSERLTELLTQMRGKRVIVFGDLMLDRFLWGSVTRISPEAPVPVVLLRSETCALGGAGNVAHNLRALGARADLVGVLGRDPGGEQFREALTLVGLDDGGIIEFADRGTTVKTRVIAHQQQVVRIDRETAGPLPSSLGEALARNVLERLPGAAALLVSDYDKGAVTAQVLQRILPAAASAGIIVAIDPKPAHYQSYRPATVITPNAQEAQQMAPPPSSGNDGVRHSGETIRDQLGCEAVLVTQGERGMTLFQSSSPPLAIPALERQVFDVTGAGDTVISAFTLARLAGGSLEEAAILANAAAGCAVGKIGTAIVSPREIESALLPSGPAS